MAARSAGTAGIVPERAVQIQWLSAAGMDVQQICDLLNCSHATVSRYRAWINGTLAPLWPSTTLVEGGKRHG